MIDNKIADKITSKASPKDVNKSKKFVKELHNNDETEEDVEITIHEKKDTYH